jgi:Protein of unknown function, DUF547
VSIRARPAGRTALALFVLVATSAAAVGASWEALFAPRAEAWTRWAAHDETSSAGIDHSAWDRLLRAYRIPAADGVARFAYGRVGAAGRAALAAYLDDLAAVPIGRYARAEQFAYWVNLYNALTVKVVLDHYPVASIRNIDISPGLFSDGPWDAELARVEGEPVSLNDIEHRILRPIWRDARVHYAVNCASVGCPDLAPEAFTAGNSDALLEAGARAYVNSLRGARVESGRLTVSSIYIWFEEDFGGSDRTVIEHLRRYADPPLAEQLRSIRSIDDDTYDWSLNDAQG